MKIVYLIAGTYNAGGMERVLTNKANWLVRHGYEVAVVTTDQRGRAPYFKLDERVTTRDLGINYDADNGRLLSKLFWFPVRQWRHRRRLEALLRELKPDVTVCMFNNDVSFVHKLKDGSRKVLEVHFSKNKKLQYARRGLWGLVDSWRTQREEWLVHRYDHFVVLTHEDKSLWEHGSSPSAKRQSDITVIPNARTFVPRQRSDLSQKRVMAIGRYDYQKGFDTLLHIWGKVLQSSNLNSQPSILNVRGWTLDIVGDGPLRPALKQQVEALGLKDSVRLLKPTDDIQSVYRSASIMVMTSRYEGLPMVLLEAQACGLPIVAFACQCGPRDVITDGTDGFLIEGRDERLFADRLCTLMTDDALRRQMGAAAAQSSERFSEDRIMQQWQKLFSH